MPNGLRGVFVGVAWVWAVVCSVNLYIVCQYFFEAGVGKDESTFIIASFTARLVIKLALKRFSISSALVLPEQRQAILKLFLDGALNARMRLRRECSVDNYSCVF